MHNEENRSPTGGRLSCVTGDGKCRVSTVGWIRACHSTSQRTGIECSVHEFGMHDTRVHDWRMLRMLSAAVSGLESVETVAVKGLVHRGIGVTPAVIPGDICLRGRIVGGL